VLVGRRSECRRLDAVLGAARQGSSGVLVLRGDAGIGKSALLTYARGQAAGMTRLEMTGVESETELAFAGLTELLLPVMDAVAQLPSSQADALGSALALNAEPANPLAVRMALLGLLGALAEMAPVLVTVDDAQWLDESSLEALSFAVRRLDAERVAVIAAARTGRPIALSVPAEAQLVVQGLAEVEARRLLVDRSGLRGRAADGLVRVAAGNPLALLELPEVVGTVPASEGVEPPVVGVRVRAAFQQRLDQLPSSARLAVGVVAADDVAVLHEILAAFTILDLGADSLGPAEREHLVTIEADTVSLRHPLLRSVAYHALSPPERREIHAALAEVIDERVALERRTWHRAAAALGPDEDVARALDQVAVAAERRGALATMAHGLARAASLSDDEDSRARRLLASAEAWLVAGHWELALDQLERAGAHAVEPGLRADIAASTGQLEAYRAGPEKGGAILVDAADLIEADDPERATRLFTYAVNVAVFAADVDRAVELAERAVRCGERAGGLNVIAATIARVEAGLLAADPTVPATLEPLAQLAEMLIESDLAHAEHVASLVALADFVLESYDRADRLLEVMVQRARDTGRLFLLAFALVLRTEIDFRRGRWQSAYEGATTEGWDAPLGLPGVGSWLHAVQARIEAGLGLDDEARAHATTALEAAHATGTHAVAAWAGASLGFLELGRGHPQAAVEHLDEVAAILERGGVAEPGILWWAPDLIEARWRMGDIGAARRRLERFQAQADATGRVWAKATAARSVGLLAIDPIEMESAFEEAMVWHARLAAPFEQGRTLLVWGERRLALDVDDADTPLGRAVATFEGLGAEPWLARARALLGPVDVVAAPVVLTRQERQVAAIVGRGHTNREAAELLFLSPRTIDFHLRNIYKKLDIRSRTELAVWMAAQEGDG
jgi:DNA-binding CsgD family transcriptional regulator